MKIKAPESFAYWFLNMEEITVTINEIDIKKRSYTVVEIAALLQISKSKAYELCKQGEFRAIKVGRSIRVSKASFDNWLDRKVNND